MAFEKNEISLYNSVNTSNPDEDVRPFTETAAPYVINTGIERDGGITNIYEREVTHSETGAYYHTVDDKEISAIPNGDLRTLKVDGKLVADVSAYGVDKRISLVGADDVILTTNDTYISCSLSGSTITLREYRVSDSVEINTRDITFTSLGTLTQFVTSLSFVRTTPMAYTDSFEFALRLGEQIVILKESTPGQSVASSIQSTTVLGSNDILDAIVYGNFLVVAGVGGRVGSYDGTNWRNYDGSGTGSGPFNNGTVVGTNNINKLAVYGTNLVVGATSGLIGSFDGNVWYASGTAGTGLWNNATVVSTDNITAMTTYIHAGTTHLIVGGHLGKLGSWDGTAWRLYSGAVGIRDNAALIGAVQINSIYIYTEYEGGTTIVVAGASGRVGSMKYMAGITYANSYIDNPGYAYTGVAYGNGTYVLVNSSSTGLNSIAYSTDGNTWTGVLNVIGSGGWADITYGDGVFVAVSNSTGLSDSIATSPDGINWTYSTLSSSPAAGWKAVQYGQGIFVALAATTSTTAGIFISSDKGANWSAVTTTAPGGPWQDISYGNGVFVAVALTASTTAGIATSYDGKSWTFRTTTAPGSNWRDVAYGNGTFVAVAATAVTTTGIATSPTGTTWTFRTTTAPGGGWVGVAYTNGLFVAVANTTSTTAGVATSTNGASWIFRTTPAPGANWKTVGAGGGRFIAITVGITSTNSIFLSVPSATNSVIYSSALFTLYPSSNALVVGANSITSSTQVGNMMVFGGGAGLVGSIGQLPINYNSNSISPTDNSKIFSSLNTILADTRFNITSLIYETGKYVGILNGNRTQSAIIYSTNLKDWTVSLLSPSLVQFTRMAYGNGMFAVVTNDSKVYYSSDLATWNYTSLSSSMTRIAFGNGIFVAVAGIINTGGTTEIYTSSNGSTWTSQSSPSIVAPAFSMELTYGNGLFVLVRQSISTTDSILTTPDGINWTPVTLSVAPSSVLDDVTYGNGKFVAVASLISATNSILYSTDGITWTYTTSGTLASMGGIGYGGGLYIITNGSVGAWDLLISTDAISWTALSLLAPYTIVTHGLTKPLYLNNNLIIPGFTASALVESTMLWNPQIAYTSSGTVIGTTMVTSLAKFGDNLVVGGQTGIIGSFNKDMSITPYTQGSGISSNGTLVGTKNISTMVTYNNQLMVGGATSTLNSMDLSGGFVPFYIDSGSGAVLANLLIGQPTSTYLYTYRYENGLYMLNLVGNPQSKSYILDNSTKAINILNAAYVIPQTSLGKTRHITTTFLPDYTTVATQVRATGLVGFTDFINWSATQVWPAAAYTLGNGNVLSCNCGPGYQDFTFRTTASATNVFEYYSPQFLLNAQAQYGVVQSNTNTLINAYGKLNNQYGLPSTKPFEWRIGLIPTAAGTSGQLSYISVALIDSRATDTLGVLVTNVGEYDPTYLPMLSVSEDTLLYRYNNTYMVVKLDKTPSDLIQHIGGNIYKINTLSPLNILDSSVSRLSVGSSDYNGRMLFTSTVAPSTSTKIASVQYDTYSNSIDVGDKLVTINPVTNVNYEVVGFRIPGLQTTTNYAIDTYVNDLYYSSTSNDGSELVNINKANLIYTNTPVTPKVVPVAIGQRYGYQSIFGINQTIFLEQNNPSNPVAYDGYRIGNKVAGTYDLFSLNNGVKYLFDGDVIYSVTIGTGGYVSNRSFVTPATGLEYVALAPTMAYFVSSFDNSLWVFMGGQSLTKYKRMNRLQTIQDGVYNVHDNTLLLQTDSELIWIRDDVLTVNYKKANQTDLSLYNTMNGIILGNDLNHWQYSFIEYPGSVVVPLNWQSAYYGRSVNQKSILSEVVYTIYDRTKSRHSVTGYVYTRDPDTATSQRVDWEILPGMYTDGGYVTLRLKPETPKSLGTSFGLKCNDKINILDATMMFSDDVNAVVEQKRSR